MNAPAHAPATPPYSVRMDGVPLTIGDRQPTFWAKVAAGRWEPETLAALRQGLAGDAAFLDIGAWVGPTSLFAAGLGARVVAVEADPAALAQLAANLALNPDLAARITVVPRAANADGRPVRLGARRKPGDSMASALLADDSGTTWETPAVTPADLAAELPATGPCLVKLDIEGGEYHLLPAMAPLIARADRGLMISFHPANLARARGEDRDAIAAATDAALAPLAGLSAHRLQPDGPAEEAISLAALRAALLPATGAFPESLTWLFRRA